MKQLKSKVMEDAYQNWIDHWHREENHVSYVESQIRAAIREFAEMSNVMELAEFVDGSPENQFNFYWKDEVKQALAAFGMEEK